MSRGYLGGQAGIPALRRADPEYKKYETGYFQSGLYAGYDHVLLDSVESFGLSEGSLRLQADYYYMGGDEGNLGSHRHQYGLLMGWKQRLSPLLFLKSDLPLHLFSSPMVGLGVANNALNFGRGFPLKKQTSLNLSARFGGGVEYCFHAPVCFGLRGDYGMERSLAGVRYFQRGWSVGSELEVRFSGESLDTSDTCWEELNKVRDAFASCEKAGMDVYDELVGLHRQIQGLVATNVKLEEAITKQVRKYREKCRDPGIVPPYFEKEAAALEARPHWAWTSHECQHQLEAARSALKECLGQDGGLPIASWNLKRDRLAKQLTQLQKIHRDLVDQLDGVIRWLYECRRGGSTTMRTPKNLILFANDNSDILLQPQKFFGKLRGRTNPDLDDWIVYLSRPENRRVRVRIHGYANDTGEEDRNLILSQERAEEVGSYLAKTPSEIGVAFGPTLVPAEEVPAPQRKNCIAETTKAGLTSVYCDIRIDSSRIDFAKGYGSNPGEIEKLRRSLKNLKIVVTEADTQHPVYRMAWLELSDREGNFE